MVVAVAAFDPKKQSRLSCAIRYETCLVYLQSGTISRRQINREQTASYDCIGHQKMNEINNITSDLLRDNNIVEGI